MSVKVAVIRTLPVFAVRALIHVGPQELLKCVAMDPHQTLSAAGAVHHSHLKLYRGNVQRRGLEPEVLETHRLLQRECEARLGGNAYSLALGSHLSHCARSGTRAGTDRRAFAAARDSADDGAQGCRAADDLAATRGP